MNPVGRSRRALRAASWALAAAALAACSGAIVTQVRYSEGRAPSSGEAIESVTSGSTKAQVLADLGVPTQIVSQAAGDVFVYRRTRIEQDVLNVNTSVLTGVTMPFYARVEGLQNDIVLMVFFDREGRARHASFGRWY